MRTSSRRGRAAHAPRSPKLETTKEPELSRLDREALLRREEAPVWRISNHEDEPPTLGDLVTRALASGERMHFAWGALESLADELHMVAIAVESREIVLPGEQLGMILWRISERARAAAAISQRIPDVAVLREIERIEETRLAPARGAR